MRATLFYILISIILITSVISQAGMASDPKAANLEPCPSNYGENYKSLLQCIGNRAPQIMRGQAFTKEGEALLGQAQEWTNPTFNLQSFKTSGNEPSGDSIQGTLLFPLDLHGLRKARTKKALLDAEDRKQSSAIEKQDVLRSSYLALQRIRQINDQIQVLKETLESLQSLTQSYRSRPKLSPEQEASFETLQLAQFEIQNRLTLSQQESHGFAHDIEIQIHESWTPTADSLPKAPLTWPTPPPLLVPSVNLLTANSALSSPILQRLRVTQEKGDAEAEVAITEKRAILQIGPSLEWGSYQGSQGFRGGLILQMPLPFVESFSGSARLAEATQNRAHVDSETEMQEVAGEMDHNREIYEQSIRGLKNINGANLSRQKVERIESLFRRGLIAGNSYLEILKQDLALRQSRDELELKAFESWCRIQALQNQFEACFI